MAKFTGKIHDEDLADNPSIRVPVCLCLDTSSSMNKKDSAAKSAISELNEGIKQFYKAVSSDEDARYSVEVAVVGFNDSVTVHKEFSLINEETSTVLKAKGKSCLGGAVLRCLEILEKRKQEYKNYGTEYHQPWLIIMTDGRPWGEDKSLLLQAQARTKELESARKLTMFPIAIGNIALGETLDGFSTKRKQMRLNGMNFTAFFEWLSKSVEIVSRSQPGDKIELSRDISSWVLLD